MCTLLFPNCGLRLPTSSAFKTLLGKSIFANQHGTLLFQLRRDLNQSFVSSIRCEENRRRRFPRRNTASGRASKGEEEKAHKLSVGESSNSSNQEEIIALFRRIETSITKEGSAGLDAKKRRSNNAKEKQSVEAVLEVVRQQPSRKQGRGKGASQGDDKTLCQNRGAPKKESSIENGSPKGDLKLSRPPSNFVKRSPIPLPSMPKEKFGEAIEELSPTEIAEKGLDLQRLDVLKLPELKDLAKSRGVKGYSKLKKGELLELLKGLLLC
ncbi:rho termination factor isoform X2 [Tasmannia lanceolata]|uniref:rho termination factor isoform X2 n=1 Tax=Tasmannia lanceolata TaxID=3420 RepID=UPI004062D4BB